MSDSGKGKTIADFLAGKSDQTKALFNHFVETFGEIGAIEIIPAKTMIGISNGNKRIAWITQLGKNFIHVVFPFKVPYADNLCFIKIAQVPGDAHQFNHHFRMYSTGDVNEEVIRFMNLAYQNNESEKEAQ